MIGFLKSAIYAAINGTWQEGYCYGLLRHAGKCADYRILRRIQSSPCRFVSRSKGSKRLAIVLAGYKPYLWPYSIERLAAFAPDDLDVCLIACGKESPEIERWASQNGWSYLSTQVNEVAHAQNEAIRRHSTAQFVFKFDEDILIGHGYFDLMYAGLMRLEQEGCVRPGFVAPLLNVNGFGYSIVLAALGIAESYAAQFGKARSAADGIPMHASGQAALWLWRNCLPFDEKVDYFRRRQFEYSLCPHRFSIGALLLRREFWNEIGGFAVSMRGGLGYDEEHLCYECVNRSRPIAVLHNVLAGHFSFGPQNDVMFASLPELAPGLRIQTPAVLRSSDVATPPYSQVAGE